MTRLHIVIGKLVYVHTIDTLCNRKQKELTSAWFQKNTMKSDILKDKKDMKNDVTNNHK